MFWYITRDDFVNSLSVNLMLCEGSGLIYDENHTVLLGSQCRRTIKSVTLTKHAVVVLEGEFHETPVYHSFILTKESRDVPDDYGK